MRVVAIDPAPGSKGSTMYSGGDDFPQIAGEKMRRVLDGERKRGPVLLCWDAPLTGPRDPENADRPGDFIQRRLDKFFVQQKWGFRTPPGIAVLPYASCWHWTISRSVLGLPRVGRYDADFDSLPFRLLPDENGEGGSAELARMDRSCIVEIHPAVAAWLWCKEEWGDSGHDGAWRYKGRKKVPKLRCEMWKVIRRKCKIGESLPQTLANDDQFDAIIGYILGVKWLRGDDDVVLLGDRENGSMLLPRTKGLCEAWEEFRDAGGA